MSETAPPDLFASTARYYARFRPGYPDAFFRPAPGTVEEVVGYLYSTSYCSPAVLGNRREPFEAEFRRTLRELSPAGVFPEEVGLGAWLAWRP